MLSGSLLSYLKKRKISRNGHSLSLVVIRCTTRCHSLSLVVPLVVTRCHSLSLVVPLIVTRCTTRCDSLSLVVIRCHSLYHSLSLVVTRCTTRLSFYKRSKLFRKSYWKSSHSFLLSFWWTRFLEICTIMELKELNWSCKHMKTSEAANLYFNEFFQ